MGLLNYLGDKFGNYPALEGDIISFRKKLYRVNAIQQLYIDLQNWPTSGGPAQPWNSGESTIELLTPKINHMYIFKSIVIDGNIRVALKIPEGDLKFSGESRQTTFSPLMANFGNPFPLQFVMMPSEKLVVVIETPIPNFASIWFFGYNLTLLPTSSQNGDVILIHDILSSSST